MRFFRAARVWAGVALSASRSRPVELASEPEGRQRLVPNAR